MAVGDKRPVLMQADRGAAGGVAALDENGKVVGAVPLDGSVPMTGNKLQLKNGAAAVSCNDSRVVINTYSVPGTTTAYRSVVLRNKNEVSDISQALGFAAEETGTGELLYLIYGEHNKPTPADIGAASAEEVRQLTEQIAALTAAINNL